MSNSENSYLEFCSDGLHFLLPLFWVESIKDEKEVTDELFLMDFCKFIGGEKAGTGRYIIILRREEIRFGILVEEVIGIREILGQKFIDLPPVVLNKDNQYLKSVFYQKDLKEEDTLAYLLEPQYLTVEKE